MNKLLLGLLAGIAIGVLVAPAKGSETLGKLRDALKGTGEDLEEDANDFAADMGKAAKKGKAAFEGEN